MQKRCAVFVFTLVVFCFAIQAEIKQKTVPLNKYSPSPVVLDIADVPEGATVDYYVKHVVENQLTAWEPVHPDFRQSATRMVFPATGGERFQFRSVLSTYEDPGMVMITDFERSAQHLLIGFESTLKLFRSDYFVYKEGHIQGTYGLGIRVTNKKDVEAGEDDVAGFFLNNRLPTLEWEPYKYLEFYLWSDFPEPFTLVMQGEKEPREMPLMQFSTDGDEPGKWHFIRIDLDQVFPDAKERRFMRSCAFTHPIKGWKQGEQREIRLDAIRLWKDTAYVETTIDDSPPEPPTELKHKHEGLQMEWSWQPSTDNESGIAGYSYSWSRSSRDNPPDEVMVTEPKVKFLFQRPPNYSDYHFKVKGMNQAGEWSAITHDSINYNPQNY